MTGPADPGEDVVESRGALLVRDILDAQLETRDHRKVGRVADVRAEWARDGTLHAVELEIGPEALAGRISPRLRRIVGAFLRDRFEHDIPVGEIAEVGPTVRLKGLASEYEVGRAEEWVARHVLRFIPGNGRPRSRPLRERY